MDQAGSGGECLELGDKWYMGTAHDGPSPCDIRNLLPDRSQIANQNLSWIMFIGLGRSLGNLPACNGRTHSAMGHLDMVPYRPDFLMDSQLSGS